MALHSFRLKLCSVDYIVQCIVVSLVGQWGAVGMAQLVTVLCSDVLGIGVQYIAVQCTMYLTWHSFSLKLCNATIDLKHSAV